MNTNNTQPENWKERFHEFGEIWTTYFGVHSVTGKSANWNMEVEAKCDTKNLEAFIEETLAARDQMWMEKIKNAVDKAGDEEEFIKFLNLVNQSYQTNKE